MVIAWSDDLEPREISLEIRNSAKSGGLGLDGGEQRVFNPAAARWYIKYTDVVIAERKHAYAWWAMLDRARAGEDILVKVFNKWKAVGADGSEPNAVAGGSASAGATSISIRASGLDLDPGAMFSVGQRLYRINNILSTGASLSIVDIILSEEKEWSDSAAWVEDGSGGALYTVSVLPPLRASISAGASVEFNDLVCLCVLADVSDGELSLDLGMFATPTISFKEP